MNFGYTSQKFLVKTKCDDCGNEAELPYTVSLPSKYTGSIPVEAGKIIGKCLKSGGNARALGEVIELKNGKVDTTSIAERAGEEFTQSESGVWNVHFTGYKADSQVVNTDNEHMRGSVSFQIWKEADVSHRFVNNGTCIVRQPSGGSHAFEEEPIEVEVPDFLKGKVHYTQFRDAVEEYIRTQFGKAGRGVSMGGKGVLKNVIINMGSKIYKVQAVDKTSGAW
jgi:hypothetical protein